MSKIYILIGTLRYQFLIFFCIDFKSFFLYFILFSKQKVFIILKLNNIRLFKKGKSYAF